MKNYIKIVIVFIARYVLRIFYVFPIKKNKILFSVHEGNSYNCNPKYIFEYMYEHWGPSYDYVWCLNNKKLLPSKFHVKCVKYLSFFHLYHLLTAKIIINNIDCNESIPGSYRNIRVYVCDEKHGGIYKPPVIHEDIKNLMAKFTEFINSDSMLQTDPLLRAAYAHYYLAMIHPFRDGNGRTSRFIESWLLCKSGFHILALLLSEYYYQNIDMYFSVFSETRRQKNMTKFFQFFLSGCMNSINTILNNKSSSCMKIDFYDAYKRHIRDGALLAENKSWANADHLYGLAAECALKALLIKSGISSTENGDISQRKFRKHIDQLWDEYHSFMLYQIYGIPEDNPFQNWKIDQRYIHSDFITKQIVENHICSIEKINKIIKQAELDGVFSNDF